MRTYALEIIEDHRKTIHAEKMTPEELYRTLAEGFTELYIPKMDRNGTEALNSRS